MRNNETTDYIDHQAIVIGVDNKSKTVTVRINNSDECGECPAATLCGSAGKASDRIVINSINASLYHAGDIVTVRGTEKMHRKAILYATVLPCIALVAVMVTVYILTLNQLAAAVSGIATMLFFFFLLWLCRNRIAHEFSFEIVGKPQRAGNEK